MSLLDPNFRYYRAAETDIRRTFARIRKQQNEAAKQQPSTVRPLRKQGAK